MKSLRQWITYTTRPKLNGKLDKIPTDWRTGNPCDAHDPAMWTDHATADFAGNGKKGFVFTDADPYWFLDIDNCLQPDNTWSPLAIDLCKRLAGAYIEVSIGGRGLHIFGAGQLPAHGTRNAALGLELYHRKRFVALGNQGHGDADRDCTAAMRDIVAEYFTAKEGDHIPASRSTAKEGDHIPASRSTAKEGDHIPASWSNAPVAEWSGSTDDEGLIEHALSVRISAVGAFGVKSGFADLWNCNVPALAAAYPAPGRDYDASSADAALAQHLAYWTGKNCERIKRLMLRSGLARDKWDRSDYLMRTILFAVSRQTAVRHDRPTPATEVATGTTPNITDPYLLPEMQRVLFDKCCYIADSNKIQLPGGHAYGRERFDAMLGGYVFVMDVANSKLTKSAWEAFTCSQANRHDKTHGSSFEPALPPGSIFTRGNERLVNTYWPIPIPSTSGDVSRFTKHLEKLLPNVTDRDIVLAYLAGIVQHPGHKSQWCLLIQGVEGNGKTLLSRCVAEAVGHRYSHNPKSQELAEKYNNWLENKIFISVEDVFVAHEKREIMEILKPMITENRLEIRSMGSDKVTRNICCNFILNSNHRDALKLTKNDRRFAVFYTAQQDESDLVRDGMGGDYFPKLYKWLNDEAGYAKITNFLQNYTIPDALNFTKGAHRAPTTEHKLQAIAESQSPVAQEVVAAINSDKVGFRDGWISSHFFDVLLRDIGEKIARNKRKDILSEQGYIWHPGLAKGQAFNPVQPDFCKPVLYVKKGHASSVLVGVDVANAYSKAQLK